MCVHTAVHQLSYEEDLALFFNLISPVVIEGSSVGNMMHDD